METRWWLNRAYGALAEIDGLGEQGHVPIIRHLEQVHTSLHGVSLVQCPQTSLMLSTESGSGYKSFWKC
jgi:hypothetical protein